MQTDNPKSREVAWSSVSPIVTATHLGHRVSWGGNCSVNINEGFRKKSGHPFWGVPLREFI